MFKIQSEERYETREVGEHRCINHETITREVDDEEEEIHCSRKYNDARENATTECSCHHRVYECEQ